jgi:hypothetical protein
MICRFRFKRGRCASKKKKKQTKKKEKIENSNLLQGGVLLVVEKPWRFSNSGLEAGPVQYYRHRRDPVPLVCLVKMADCSGDRKRRMSGEPS